jgi:hypothetical protein
MHPMCTRRWSIILVLVMACGGAIRVPSGGRSWTEVSSEHFVMWTDDSAARGRELLEQFERRRQIMVTALSDPPSKAKTFVVALRHEGEVDPFLSPLFRAAAWSASNPVRQPGILLATNHQGQEDVVNHELAHVVSFGIIKHQPGWIAEGLATFFETAALQSDNTFADIGYPRHDRMLVLGRRGLPSIADLFECKKSHCKDERYYAMCWALFSFLVNQYPTQLAQYLQRLNESSQEGVAAELWRASFPDLPPEKLDRELFSWLYIGEYRPIRVKLKMPRFSVTARALADADVLALRGFLHLWLKGDQVTAGKDAEAAVALDRTNVLARLIQDALERPITADDALATTAAHPDDYRAWLLLERVLRGSPEANAALTRACSLAASVVSECDRVTTARKEAQR